jgi:hypothetical protein
MNFQLGRYYLRNGFRAKITNSTIAADLLVALGFVLYYGFVLIPDNIWVPTFWYGDGSSLDSKFDLMECVEGKEEKIVEWEKTR